MTIIWKDSVKNALLRFSAHNNTKNISRQALIDAELPQVIAETHSTGETPWQTMSRVLQELRDENFIEFLGNGNYLLLETPINVEAEDLPEDALDLAIKHNKLLLGMLPADSQSKQQRVRIGQSRIRKNTLEIYRYRCAFCDVDENGLLVAGHISRWADDPLGRGDLRNLICMCRFHDAMFEYGLFTMQDNYRILKKVSKSITINALMNLTNEFHPPFDYAPLPKYLEKHRSRSGLWLNP